MTIPVRGPDSQPLDQIRLTGIKGVGYHGVLLGERQAGQVFEVDVTLHLEAQKAAEDDDLGATANYAEVAERVHAVITGEPFALIEAVAEHVAAAALTAPTVLAVDVVVHKPAAPISVPFEDVAVAIRRDRVRKPPAPARYSRAPQLPVNNHEPCAESQGHPAGFPNPGFAPPPSTDSGEPRHSAAAERIAESTPSPLDTAPPHAIRAVLALGANLGDPIATLRQAVTDLDSLPGVTVYKVSPLARTAAVGGPAGQPDFYNAVALVDTTYSPRELLAATQSIEAAHGRTREIHHGPRTLDIDVITYGSLASVEPDLTLPHPLAAQRAFVLVPWAHIDPTAELPGLGGGPVSALAATAPDAAGIRSLALDWLDKSGSGNGVAPTPAAAPPAPAASAPALATDTGSAPWDPGSTILQPAIPPVTPTPPSQEEFVEPTKPPMPDWGW